MSTRQLVGLGLMLVGSGVVVLACCWLLDVLYRRRIERNLWRLIRESGELPRGAASGRGRDGS